MHGYKTFAHTFCSFHPIVLKDEPQQSALKNPREWSFLEESADNCNRNYVEIRNLKTEIH